MTAEKIATALGGRRNGRGWSALCPSHDDTTPSLDIDDKDGRVLLICRAGCAQDAVIAALRERGLWPEAKASGNNIKPKIVAVYRYTDEAGKLLFETCRFEPGFGGKKKNFRQRRQRRPDDDPEKLRRAGIRFDEEWVWSLDGVRRVPYRLPELIGADPSRFAFGVEGEKDADRLASDGFIATTNPMGAGKWTEELTTYFKGRKVALLRDNDRVGAEHQRKVASSLIGTAAEVRLIELPGLPEKGDVSDWLDRGGTAERLKEIVRDAKPVTADDLKEEKPSASNGADHHGDSDDDVTAGHKKTDDDPRRGIDVTDEDGQRILAQTWRAIGALNARPGGPVLFRTGAALTRIVAGVEDRVALDVVGSRGALFEIVTDAARFERCDLRKKDSPARNVLPPHAILDALIDGGCPPVPELLRIVHAPVFASDGTLQTKPGYNPAARVYFHAAPGFSLDPIPERPTEEELISARDALLEPFQDFPFETAADRAHTVALVLGPIVRELIAGPTPLHLVEKPEAGSGAGLLVNVAAYISLGTWAPITPCPRTFEEWGKTLTAKLLKGSPFLVLDNLHGTLMAAELAAAVTGDFWDARVLGSSRMPELPIRTIWVVTANNPTFTREMLRRTVRIRLIPNVEHPWLRKPEEFRINDLRAWTIANRARLVHAALILTRGWIVAGRPPWDGLSLGTFESWSGVMGGILAHAGVPGFLTNTVRLYEEVGTDDGAEWQRFVTLWWEKLGETPVRVRELLGLLDQTTVDPPDLQLGKEDERAHRLGNRLKQARGQIIGTRMVVRDRESKRGALWKLVDTTKESYAATDVGGGSGGNGGSPSAPPKELQGEGDTIGSGEGDPPQPPDPPPGDGNDGGYL